MTEPSELIILNISCQIPGKADGVFNISLSEPCKLMILNAYISCQSLVNQMLLNICHDRAQSIIDSEDILSEPGIWMFLKMSCQSPVN